MTVISPDIDLDERKMVLFFPPILQEHFYDAASGSGYLAWRLKKTFKETTLVTLKGRISLTLNKEFRVQTVA